ncbi:MAG TPA: hypothetical protein VHN15_08060 [Thermoanaerobaculia bacterium]|nr:hypothetical protein [Thermoanaerobaculia bacterium]
MLRAKELVACSALFVALLLAGAGVSPLRAAAPAAPAADNARPIPSFTQPSLAPDGSQIVFASGGDLWTVPANGGAAYLLVSHAATESRPLFSPDGRHLAFVSNRTGNGDLYLLTFATGEVRRLTWDDEGEQLDAWSPDSRWIYFSSSARDMGGMNDLYRVRPEGGTPMMVSDERYLNEFAAAPSPDGNRLAFNARSIAAAQWWRHGRSHIDETEIWTLGEDGRYDKVQEGGAKQLWPMWSADGRRLYFTSDRSGVENLWVRDLGGSPTGGGPEAVQISRFQDGRVLWPSISRDGKTIVFERGLAVWSFDTTTREAREVPITLQGAPAASAPEFRRLTNEIDEMALSPDGKKVALVVRGEVFAASAKDGGNAARVTSTPGAESQPVWAPDSRRLLYTADRDGEGTNLFLYDFATGAETQLTKGAFQDHSPRFSPDGKQVAFQRGRGELRLLELATRKDRLLTEALLDAPPLNSERPFVWSPDGRWIAYLNYAGRMFRNVVLVPVGQGNKAEPRQVSFLANAGASAVSWSPDGKYLLFDTGQRTETGQLARVDLLPRTPKFREDQFRDLFRQETPPAIQPAPENQVESEEEPAAEPTDLPEDTKDSKDS